MSNSLIPIFDVGDTFLPSKEVINETIQEEVPGAPEMDIYSYNIYRPAEIRKFLDDNELEGRPYRITARYHDKIEEHLKENDLFEMMKKCREKYGRIGIISDNTLEMKYFWKDMLERHDIEVDIIVSEEVGVKKPDPELFEAFLDLRDEPAENFVYFGNSPERDGAAEKVGMHFVWVSAYEDFGSDEHNGVQIDRLNFENVQEALNEVRN